MVKLLLLPLHPFACGVTVIVPVTVDVVELAVRKGNIFPVPELPNPMLVALLVQVKVEPATGPVRVINAVESPAQTNWLVTAVRVGVGFTVMVKVLGVPLHPFLTGITVIVATNGADVVLVVENAPIFPVPLAASPIAGVLFVQVYVVPVNPPEKLIAAVFVPLHFV
jgi:hypothetical protein